MGKIYNKLARADYLNNYDPEYLLEVYKRLSTFYDCKECPFEDVGLLNETQVKTYYNHETKIFSIAFECSRSNRVKTKFPIAIDWIINFIALPSDILHEPCNQGKTGNFTKDHKTHAGFALAFYKIIDYIEGKIQEVLNNDKEINGFEIYGWSYGGAMATLCHGWIANKYCLKIGLKKIPSLITMTIGAPRVFCKLIFNIAKSKKWINLKNQYQHLYLFSNINDLVTMMPPKILTFTHIMPKIKLEGKFNIKKIFQPNIYHQKSRYDELIINKLTQEIEAKKENVVNTESEN